MPRQLRPSIRPTEEATTQQLSLPLTENHPRASSGANEPQKRTRSPDTPTRISEQPARKRRARKKAKAKIPKLPHEIILNIMRKLGFSKDDFTNMLLASRTFNELFVANKKSILNDIAAQQFPIASLVVAHGASTVQWLIEAKDLEDRTDEFLSACTESLEQDSPQFEALADPHYRMIARVGLNVLSGKKANIEFGSDSGNEELRLYDRSYNVDETLLLCISFAAAVISQALESVIVVDPYQEPRQDIDERFRRASDSLLCNEGWDNMMGLLVGPSHSSEAFESGFLDLVEFVDMDDWYDEKVEYVATELSDVGGHFRAQVERVVGKHETRQELDLAIIDALEESEVSEEAILELLKGENWW